MHVEPISYSLVTVDASGMILRQKSGVVEQLLVDIGQDQLLAMLALPRDSFQMGSPDGIGYVGEKPRHDVSVESFLIGRYPVTQAQWTAVMGEKSSRSMPFTTPDDDG